MPIDREVLEAIREMDEPELRRLFMLTRARLERKGHEFPDLGPGVKVRTQMVRCGKDSCSSCPHGPYIYAYWTQDGKQRSKYLGKVEDLPEEEDSSQPTADSQPTAHSRQPEKTTYVEGVPLSRGTTEEPCDDVGG